MTVKYYEEVVKDPDTDYGLVFQHKRANKDLLEQRVKKYIEIKDNCQPIFEMIDKGTTSIQDRYGTRQTTGKPISQAAGMDPESLQMQNLNSSQLT